MTLTFEFEEFEIVEETKEDFTLWKTVLCEVDLVITELPQAPIMPSLSDPGEPGWPAEFEIHEVRLVDVQDDVGELHRILYMKEYPTLTLTETNFITFFSGGQDVINNAYEWAAEQEIDYDDA